MLASTGSSARRDLIWCLVQCSRPQAQRFENNHPELALGDYLILEPERTGMWLRERATDMCPSRGEVTFFFFFLKSLLNLLQYIYFFVTILFLFYALFFGARRHVVSPALEGSLNHWTSREVMRGDFHSFDQPSSFPRSSCPHRTACSRKASYLAG